MKHVITRALAAPARGFTLAEVAITIVDRFGIGLMLKCLQGLNTARC